MSGDALLRCRWNGETLVPVGNWSKAWCLDNLDMNELVNVDVDRHASGKSRRHQFAAIDEAWKNLPESLSGLDYTKSPATLRKHALIVTGFRNVRLIDAGSIAAAERIAAMMREDALEQDAYCIVQVSGQMVRRFMPESQSAKAMGRERFQQSKDAVLNWISDLIRVTREDLEAEVQTQ